MNCSSLHQMHREAKLMQDLNWGEVREGKRGEDRLSMQIEDTRKTDYKFPIDKCKT